jgi:hypothetical protein
MKASSVPGRDLGWRVSLTAVPMAGWVILGITAAALGSRFLGLGADPPAWVDSALLTDEGWWADAARGRVLFGDYAADDLGYGILFAPFYTLALQALYSVVGVGLPQLRLLAAICSLLVIGLIGLTLWKRVGSQAALTSAVLLLLSPFWTAYGRVGFTEPMESLFLIGSFSSWILWRRSLAGAFLSGVLLAGAIAAKVNAGPIVVLPMGAVWIIGCWYEYRRSVSGGLATRAALMRAAAPLVAASTGFAVLLLVVGLLIVVPQWDLFWKMTADMFALAQGGEGNIANPGLAFVSMEAVDYRILIWRVARWSPAIMTAAWLYLLSAVLRWSVPERRATFTELEVAVLCLTVAASVSIFRNMQQPDRRWVLVLPGFAMLAVLFLSESLRHRFREAPGSAVRPAIRPAVRAVFWVLCLMPVLVLVKPWASLQLQRLLSDVQIGSSAGIPLTSAGLGVMCTWLAAGAMLAIAPLNIDRIGYSILRVGSFVVVALLGAEAVIQVRHLTRLETTLVDQQARLEGIVVPGETVLGQSAAVVFHPIPVRTVRRNLDPRPIANPDVAERLRPRYVLETRIRDFQPAPRLYEDVVTKGYRSAAQFAVGPYIDGKPRVVFELFEKSGAAVAAR